MPIHMSIDLAEFDRSRGVIHRGWLAEPVVVAVPDRQKKEDDE